MFGAQMFIAPKPLFANISFLVNRRVEASAEISVALARCEFLRLRTGVARISFNQF
jgi:hypothetical protein